MQEYSMPSPNTCRQCGQLIPEGEPVYAENPDQVRAGSGICESCRYPNSGHRPGVELTPDQKEQIEALSESEETVHTALEPYGEFGPEDTFGSLTKADAISEAVETPAPEPLTLERIEEAVNSVKQAAKRKTLNRGKQK